MFGFHEVNRLHIIKESKVIVFLSGIELQYPVFLSLCDLVFFYITLSVIMVSFYIIFDFHDVIEHYITEGSKASVHHTNQSPMNHISLSL